MGKILTALMVIVFSLSAHSFEKYNVGECVMRTTSYKAVERWEKPSTFIDGIYKIKEIGNKSYLASQYRYDSDKSKGRWDEANSLVFWILHDLSEKEKVVTINCEDALKEYKDYYSKR